MCTVPTIAEMLMKGWINGYEDKRNVANGSYNCPGGYKLRLLIQFRHLKVAVSDRIIKWGRLGMEMICNP